MTRPLWTYVCIAYGITWTIVLGIYFLYKQATISRDELNIYFNFGALGPFLASIITAYIFYGKTGLAKLFSAFDPSRLERKSTLLALSPLLFFAFGWLIYPLLTERWFTFDITKQQFSLTTTATYFGWGTPYITYALFEELVWRGFALPHLQEKYSAFKSTFFLAIMWALWHAPMFLFRFNFSLPITFGFFFGIFVGAVILTAIFNFSHGSILAAILFHLANNIASAFDMDYIVAVVSTGFVFLAIYLLMTFKMTDLADKARVKNYFRA